jgi:hypothetical protein
MVNHIQGEICISKYDFWLRNYEGWLLVRLDWLSHVHLDR